jgi:hypothetical protein
MNLFVHYIHHHLDMLIFHNEIHHDIEYIWFYLLDEQFLLMYEYRYMVMVLKQ